MEDFTFKITAKELAKVVRKAFMEGEQDAISRLYAHTRLDDNPIGRRSMQTASESREAYANLLGESMVDKRVEALCVFTLRQLLHNSVVDVVQEAMEQ